VDDPAAPVERQNLPGMELTAAGAAKIVGLTELLGPAGFNITLPWKAGNILLGGGGRDLIEGKGGNDLIDGDGWLDVQLVATLNDGTTRTVSDPRDLIDDVFSDPQRLDPGNIRILRTIRLGPPGIDTAVFRGNRDEYDITVNANGSVTVAHARPPNQAILNDGVDILRNVELLAFLDVTIPTPTNQPATGTVTISDLTPTEDQLLALTNTIVDPDGINAATLVFTWQAETAPGVFTAVATGPTFAPGDAVVGRALRVVATFQDLNPVPNAETITSAATAPVIAVNDVPTGAPVLTDATPQVGAQLAVITTSIADADGLGPFTFQWLADGTPIAGAVAVSFTPTAAQLGQSLSARVTYTDLQGFTQSLTSAPSAAVSAANGPIVSVPPVLAFGLRRLNTSTIGQLVVTNAGTQPLVVSSVVSSGAPFISPTRGTCTAPVAPGRSCRVAVTFRPTAAGTFAGTLTIGSNASNSPTLVSLTGVAR
jgi:hypothetical protein